MSDAILKPCPFCGATAELTDDYGGDDPGWCVRCMGCNALGPFYDEEQWPEPEQRAMLAWNHRYESDAIHAD